MNKYTFLLHQDYNIVKQNRSRILIAFPELKDVIAKYGDGCTNCSAKKIGRSILCYIIDHPNLTKQQLNVMKGIIPNDVLKHIGA